MPGRRIRSSSTACCGPSTGPAAARADLFEQAACVVTPGAKTPAKAILQTEELWSAVGGRDHYQNVAVADCGVGSRVANTVLAWDKDKLSAMPTWADFWDVAKYPGKRGLSKSPRAALEIALLADGVAVPDVYKTLASKEGQDRAFQKLDQLKPYIVWWQTGQEAAHILGSGEVLMTTAQSARIAMAAKAENKNFGIQWAGTIYEVYSWAIAKGSPHVKTAQQYLYFAGFVPVQARLMRQSTMIGWAKGTNDLLPLEVQALSPTANLAGALKQDTAFWHDNDAKLRQRFDAWLSKQN